MRTRAISGKGTKETSIKIMRPPCRQGDNVYDLDDSHKIVRKPIRIIRKAIRPPSRHRTHPKALGLEFDPNDKFAALHEPVAYTNFSSTQPIHFSDLTKPKHWKLRADSVKSQNKNEKNATTRVWSAKHSDKKVVGLVLRRSIETSQRENNEGKRAGSRVKQQNVPIFSGLKSEFLDLFA